MIHIIVVSHYHDKYIFSLVNKLCNSDCSALDCFRVYIKDNVNSVALRDYCEERNVFYLPSDECSGFARNNNLAVRYICERFEINDNDYFLMLNPDVLIDLNEVKKLSDILKNKHYDLFTVDLFKDMNMMVRDPSIRRFPKVVNFITSFFLGYNKSIIDRSCITTHQVVDWCAGSFLGVRTSVFNEINGFDENIFMYCEDIDICIRAKDNGHDLYYIPDIKAIHFSQNDNRKIFSKNFIWHLKSIIYIYRKHMLKLF